MWRAVWHYGTRILPALSLCLLTILLVLSFVLNPFGRLQNGAHHGAAIAAQWVLSAYAVVLNILSVAFPARAIYAMENVIRRIGESATDTQGGEDNKKALGGAGQVETEKSNNSTPNPIFVVIIPAYKEAASTLQETLRVLAKHPQARHCYHIFLAMEEKEEGAAAKASGLVSFFEKAFYRIEYCVHPYALPDEAPGKSSNESWAAKQACHSYRAEVKENVVITVVDADTHLSSRYFAEIAKLRLADHSTRDTTMYMPPIVFDRNFHHLPLLVRIADILWAGAGISSMYPNSSVCIPTSVYSLPMTLVEHVGYWDVDAGAIGEDMHMYLKCFFALSGNLNVQVIPAAASQSSISTPHSGIQGYFDRLRARYDQALRHMWGSLDSGYAVRECVSMLRRHRKAFHEQDSEASSEASTDSAAFEFFAIQTENVLTLFQRIFEAHFLPIHLILVLLAESLYTLVYPHFLIPGVLRLAIELSAWCRGIGYCLMLCFFYRYEHYHRLCCGLRREEMRIAGLLEGLTDGDGFTPNVFLHAGLAEAALFPLAGIVYGAIPALQAVVTHIFTERLAYVVSLKEVRETLCM